jgi:predicted TIM-barrel fold metal-dependent hydrolase
VTVPILDTHQHLIYADRLRYTVTDDVPVLAHKSFTYPDYQAAIEGTGIDATIFMETNADEWEQEFDFVRGFVESADTQIIGIIAPCRPEDAAGFEPWIQAHLGKPLAGLRRVCHTEPDDFTLQQSFVNNIALLANYNLGFDLCFLGRQLPYAIRLAQHCPNTQMVLDHCGVPDIAHGEWETWKASIKTLAQLPNVACKVSGVLAYCRPDRATLTEVRPYVEHCIECFGFDRLVWGSDWPFCNQTTTLKYWVEVSRELLQHESLEVQRKVFFENGMRIYNRSAEF